MNYLTLALTFLLFTVLTKSSLGTFYAAQGLHLWLESMFPALLPFMILSGIMVRTDMAEVFSGLFSPLLSRIFRCRKTCCYVIVMGFLTGLPMGAKAISDLYRRKKLSEKESRWLLSFCNNAGPAYLLGFVLPTLKLTRKAPVLILFYGIPFFYGLLLRHLPFYQLDRIIREPDPGRGQKPSEPAVFLAAMEDSVSNAMITILNLGGYMILFCLLNTVPHWITGGSQPILGMLFEITSGIQGMQGTHPILCLSMLCFGGLSCIAQTHACLKETALTKYLGEYCLHKCILAALTLIFFTAAYHFFPRLFI